MARSVATLTLVCICLSLTLCSVVDAQLVSPPYMIKFDTGRHDATAYVAHSKILAEFLPPTKPFRVFEESELQVSFAKYLPSNPEGFELVCGTGYSTISSGSKTSYAFRAVANEAVFRQFVQDRISARGDGVKILGNDLQVQLSGPQIPPIPGKPVISWNDVYFAYGDGVFVLAEHPIAFEIPLSALANNIEVGRGKDWGLWIMPGNVPARQRAEFFRQLELQLGVDLQRRDDELGKEYAVRRLFGENYLALVHSMLFDIDECVAWREDARDDRPFHAHFEARIKPGSDFTNLVRQFRSERFVSYPKSDDTVISAAINLSIPEMFRAGLHALVANSVLRDTPSGTVADQTIQTRHLNAGVRLMGDDKRRLVLSGKALVEGPEVEASAVATLFGGTVTSEGNALIPIAVDVWGQSIDAYQLMLSHSDSMLQFHVIPHDAESRIQDTAFDNPELSGGVSPLIAVHGDLQHGVDTKLNAAKTQLLMAAESMYHRWMYFQVPAEIRTTVFRHTLPTQDFESLSAHLAREGDWTFDVTLNAAIDGETLVADCHVGRSLYGLFCARHFLSMQAVQNMDPTPRPAIGNSSN